mmetsp:Transcript_35625/g.100847  ORF Transcript_35625/g.100847 Transcript_35625/m.100847 type:complete len:275 (+) Transcript_35625:1911-2735(+)
MLTRRFSPPERPRKNASPMYVCITFFSPSSWMMFMTRCTRLSFGMVAGRRSFAWNIRYSITSEEPGKTSSCRTYPLILILMAGDATRPFRRTSPDIPRPERRPANMSSKVVLPAPLGPMRAAQLEPLTSGAVFPATPVMPLRTGRLVVPIAPLRTCTVHLISSQERHTPGALATSCSMWPSSKLRPIERSGPACSGLDAAAADSGDSVPPSSCSRLARSRDSRSCGDVSSPPACAACCPPPPPSSASTSASKRRSSCASSSSSASAVRRGLSHR